MWEEVTLDMLKLDQQIDDNEEKVKQIRSRIIEKAIRVEGKIDAILTSYFIIGEKKSMEFLISFLGNEHVSFVAKRTALVRLKHPSLSNVDGYLHEIGRIRNIFAHGNIIPHPEIPSIWVAKDTRVDDASKLEDQFDTVIEKLALILDQAHADIIAEREQQKE